MALSKTNVAARADNIGNLVLSCPKCDKEMKETYIKGDNAPGMYYLCACGERIRILKGQRVYRNYKHKYL